LELHFNLIVINNFGLAELVRTIHAFSSSMCKGTSNDDKMGQEGKKRNFENSNGTLQLYRDTLVEKH